jgi:hypothetical protein
MCIDVARSYRAKQSFFVWKHVVPILSCCYYLSEYTPARRRRGVSADRGQELSYRLGCRTVSPSGPGIHAYTSALYTEHYAVLKCEVPIGAIVRENDTGAIVAVSELIPMQAIYFTGHAWPVRPCKLR